MPRRRLIRARSPRGADRYPRALIASAAALVSVCGMAACGSSTARPRTLASLNAQGTSRTRHQLCAGPPAAMLARAAGQVAERIYRQELTGPGVHTDRRQVENDVPLLRALASENRVAIHAAVTKLVYSHTHIVRLRVTARSGAVVDVGGRYIIAPAGGTLRLHGRAVGRYLLSVQDDLGYVKLETRFVGLPVALFSGSRELPLEGAAAFTASNLPEVASVTYRGTRAEAYSFTAKAFPSGTLRVTLLVPIANLHGSPRCDAVRAIELGLIGERIWGRYALVAAPPQVVLRAIRRLTGGLGYVRVGSRQLAGSTLPGPRALPASGTVKYRGLAYRLFPLAQKGDGCVCTCFSERARDLVAVARATRRRAET
jgi:hypothetical protein